MNASRVLLSEDIHFTILPGRIAYTGCKNAACCYRCSVVCVSVSVCLSVCVCLCLSVCLLDTTVSPAKTDEPIEMLFGLWTRVSK